jgi:hypothetical protein
MQSGIQIQINQRVDERFNSAINLLGSSETSARTGAVYALHELALKEGKYRQQINPPLDTVHAENSPPQGRRVTNPP